MEEYEEHEEQEEQEEHEDHEDLQVIQDNEDIIENFNNHLQVYKQTLYLRIIPDDISNDSQELLDEYENTLKNDAIILLDSENNAVANTNLTNEFIEFLLPFFTSSFPFGEQDYFAAALKRNLITYPFSRSPKHAVELIKNGQ